MLTESKPKKAALPEWVPGVAMGILWMSVFPLWNCGSYGHITKDKLWGMYILTGLSLLLSVAVPAQSLKSGGSPEGKKNRIRSASWLLLGLFLGWTALACLFGANHGKINPLGQPAVLYGSYRHDGLFTLLCYGTVFFCMSLARPRMTVLVRAAAVALDLAAGLAALQYFDLNPLGLFMRGTGIMTHYEFQSTIGNIDLVSQYICVVLPLVVGGWFLERNGGFLLFSALVGIEWMLCMEVTSGLLVLMGCAGVTALAALRFSRLRRRALLFLSGFTAMLALRRMIRLPWLDDAGTLSLIPSADALLLLLPALLLFTGAFICGKHPGKNISWKWLIPGCAAIAAAGMLIFLSLDLPEPDSLLPFDLSSLAAMEAENAGKSAGADPQSTENQAAGNVPMESGISLPKASSVPESIRLEGPSLSDTLWQIQQVLKGKMQDSFGSNRIRVWRRALLRAGEYPLFGLGPGTFRFIIQLPVLTERGPLEDVFDNPHNVVLQVLVDGGIPAACFFLCLLLLLIISGIRRGGWNSVLSLSVAAWLLQGMFTFSICVVTPVFWAVAGMSTHCLPLNDSCGSAS